MISIGFIVNIVIRLSIFYFLGEVILWPDDPRFAGKAIPLRNLVIVLSLSLLMPFFYFLKKRWKKYPFWFDNIYLSIFWLDMAGNSLDLYDSYFYFDLVAHFHGTGAIAAVFLGAFGMRWLWAMVLANSIHLGLEVQEYLTDVFFGTHNVRGMFDSVNDVLAGILGTAFYVGLLILWQKNWRRRLLEITVIILITFSLLVMFFHRAVASHVMTLLFLSEQFPQVPLKPLGFFTSPPSYRTFKLESKNGQVVADLFLPVNERGLAKNRPRPAVILAMGVKTSEKDKPIIINLAKSFSRLGYVVLWPRREELEQGKSLPEEPETFITAFQYLKEQKGADEKRISLVGFSVGSSIAMVASANAEINEEIRAIVFFGGYYDIFSYLESLNNKTVLLNGQNMPWQPAEGAVNHFKEILETEAGLAEEDRVKKLRSLSPKEAVSQFKAAVFILHDKGDSYVPYSEAIKLKEVLPKEQVKTFSLVNLFEHVQPRSDFSPEIIGEFFQVYGFVYSVFNYL
ncbi:hypothetical protein HYT17_01220 [Candidatus Microgenomates bacterium]|nr:hypothetical protein [Candidatus Microgenomates bacterium]